MLLVLKTVKTPVTMARLTGRRKPALRANMKNVNESCNKDYKALSRSSFVWLDKDVMVPNGGGGAGYTRYWNYVIFFIEELSNLFGVTFPQKMSCKSGPCLVLLNNQIINLDDM